ncbi:kinase-like protein [Curvularia clavata]|uniref:Kinase-like protein n=1 Tax=Curvularia clavata TaxID=95742 RepID=A0A9Q8ZFL9_CURCL|nr:kinase-like protein [Curvularia clavata]
MAPVTADLPVPLAVCNHTSTDGLSREFKFNPEDPDIHVFDGKGEFMGSGVTGLVELLDSGDVIKSPWTSPSDISECMREMEIEAQIYERLGVHPRLVLFKHWDPVEHTLTLEYMPNGSLMEYIQQHREEISLSQRQQWVMEAAEGIELLHSHDVIHADVGPHNFLLDSSLSLKISDFGGSSLDGSKPVVVPSARYRLPGSCGPNATVKEDLFALGSTIYFIATGHEPYEELTDEHQVEELYKNGAFPELSDVPFAEVISLCWKQEVESAQMLIKLMQLSP